MKKILLISIILSLCHQQLVAAETIKWYELELIVFKNPYEDNKNELWQELRETELVKQLKNNLWDKDYLTELLAKHQTCNKNKVLSENNNDANQEVLDVLDMTIRYPLPDERCTEEQVTSNNNHETQTNTSASINANNEKKPTENNIELIAPLALSDEEFTQPIKHNELQLGAIRKKLLQRNYQVIQHLAWKQQLVADYNSKKYRIIGGMKYSHQPMQQPSFASQTNQDNYLFDNTLNPSTTSSISYAEIESVATEDTTVKKQMDSIPIWELDGSVTLHLKRYLHLELDLQLHKPDRSNLFSTTLDATTPTNNHSNQNYFDGWLTASSSEPAWQLNNFSEILSPKWQVFQIKQQRKVKRNDIQYFDHPKFSVIAQIRVVEQEVIQEDLPEIDLLDQGLLSTPN